MTNKISDQAYQYYVDIEEIRPQLNFFPCRTAILHNKDSLAQLWDPQIVYPAVTNIYCHNMLYHAISLGLNVFERKTVH